jgi:hypothetical protein
MCTFGTGSSEVSGEGENSTNTLKNCAKIAAKINGRPASEFDEFQHVCNGYLECYTNRARPPYALLVSMSTVRLGQDRLCGVRASEAMLGGEWHPIPHITACQ